MIATMRPSSQPSADRDARADESGVVLRLCLMVPDEATGEPKFISSFLRKTSMPVALASPDVNIAIEIQGERRAFKIKDGVGDVRNFAHPADGVKGSQEAMTFLRVHRRLDDPGRDRVHADPARRIFNRQALGRRRNAALGQRGKYRRHL